MQISLVRQAFDAYSTGHFAKALRLYRKLATTMGQDFFSVNIAFCLKELQRHRLLSGVGPISLRKIKVACIMDDFTFASYEPECILCPLTPQNFTNELEDFAPDMLFVESAWNGKDNLWNHKISHISEELRNVLEWCQNNNVPTAFWNKEDPVHFNTFLSTAQLFDFVFTTDIDCISLYKSALKHNQVFLLPFACQPTLHNPVERYTRKDAFCFAGAYYVRYPERTRDLENYIETLPPYKPLEIFDRNFGKTDTNYQFPESFHPFIMGTLPYSEMDKVYKGYSYSINLNSIKNSQSMFARRVFELLSSNTVVLSNYSRGMRLFFGDLVLTSDNGEELIHKLKNMDATAQAKLRLAGLRKVYLQHTYEHRLQYIASTIMGYENECLLPELTCVTFAPTAGDVQWVFDNYQRQTHKKKRLLLILGDRVEMPPLDEKNATAITVLPFSTAKDLSLASAIEEEAWVTLLHPKDYYGPNYLLDLALATKYSDCIAIGKGAHYQWTEHGLSDVRPETAYQKLERLPYRCCTVASSSFTEDLSLGSLVAESSTLEISGSCLGVDPFNYCKNGRKSNDMASMLAVVNDLLLDEGLPLNELLHLAENTQSSSHSATNVLHWDSTKLMRLFCNYKHEHVQFTQLPEGLRIHSTLPNGLHEYAYATTDFPLSSLPFSKTIKCCLESAPGLSIQYVFIFMDSDKEKISHCIFDSNKNHVAEMPEHTAFVRFGFRIYGSGSTLIPMLLWAHREFEPSLMLHRSSTVLVTNHYPEYSNLYRNAFVHSRVKAYKQSGCCVDVFRFQPHALLGYHEFENIDVITGNEKHLRKLLATGSCRTVLVHFLNAEMWDILKDFPECTIIVWVHGAEIQPWTRRAFNYQTAHERKRACTRSDARTAFWRTLLSAAPPNLRLVFVSRHFAEEVMEDLGFRLPENNYTIIHNPIDTELFSYKPKDVEQRKKILSIHSYASAKYANDLSVQAIQLLASEAFFSDLEFRMIGNGPLFDATLEPIRNLPNVICEQRYLTQREISLLHGEYGVFLSPTRWDSQGVSRNEAMSSGLVPITNAVAAIPEFMDTSCAMLAPEENAQAMAEAIRTLYTQPQLFTELSRAAAERVQKQTAARAVIAQELSLFTPSSDQNIQQTYPADSDTETIRGSLPILAPAVDVHSIQVIRDIENTPEPVPQKTIGGKPIAFLSFDVEALIGRAEGNLVDRLIWGEVNGQNYGIGRLCAILKEYGMKANFMIDMGGCALHGDRPIERAGKFLRDQGHEIHVHLHSELLFRQWQVPLPKGFAGAMDKLDYQISEHVLKHAAFKFKQLYGTEPYAFRAGAFLFNKHTVQAAAASGFRCLTNFNKTRFADKIHIAKPVADNEPFLWENGLLEIPVDMSPEPLSFAFEKYIGMFDRVPRKTNKTFNITLHSWTLLKRIKEHHKEFAPEYEKKFRAICEHLLENTDIKGYSEYHQSHTIKTGTATELQFERINVSLEKITRCPICSAIFPHSPSDLKCIGCGSLPRHRQIHDFLQRRTNPFDGKKVLACYANSLEIAFILDKVHSLTNFDIRPVHEADMQMDIQNMRVLQDASFDAFMAVHVLNHVKDDHRAIQEVHRILAPGGAALITIPYREGEPTKACSDITQHYGEKNFNDYGIGTYRTYGFDDAVELFSRYFSVVTEIGTDSISNDTMRVFLLIKNEKGGPDDAV